MMNRRSTGLPALPPSAWPPPLRCREPLKIGFVYVGPVGDAGWTYAHDQGRLAWKRNWAPKSKPATWKTCRKARTRNA
jgi:simple sugar transport system substrate-binding protein